MPGELFVRASSVFSTYHKAHDKYADEHRGDWHTVGDIAYRDDEGYLFICDRKTDMVISGGVNIYPAEIEAVLEQHPGVFDVAIISRATRCRRRLPSWTSYHALARASSSNGN